MGKDNESTIDDLKRIVQQFCEARDWDQYHNAKDLAIGIITESSELLDIFRFKSEREIAELFGNPAKREKISEETADIFLIAANIIGIPAVIGGLYFFKKITANIRDSEIEDKLSKFRTGMIIRAAATEGAGFIFIVGYLISNSSIFLIEVIITLAVMVYFFPTNERLSKEMDIDLRNFNQNLE